MKRKAGKTAPGRRGGLSKARLREMIEEATVDAYGESEQVGGFYTMIDELVRERSAALADEDPLLRAADRPEVVEDVQAKGGR